MSIADKLTKLTSDITDAYGMIEEKGGTLPEHKNTDNLSDAIASIPGGGGEADYGTITFMYQGNLVEYHITDLAEFIQLHGNYTTDRQLVFGSYQISSSNVMLYEVGNDVDAVGDYFLNYFSNLSNIMGVDKIERFGVYFISRCNNFNPTEIRLNANVKNIPENFLFSNTKFNAEVILNEGLETIGTNFMSGCTVFKKNITLPSTVLSIGTYFMQSCGGSTSRITLNEGLQTIGNSFLYNARPTYVYVPSTLTSIGTEFCRNCYSLTSVATMTTVHPTDNYSLAGGSASQPYYQQGITLTGTGASAWKDALPDRTSNPYRKLILG